MGSRSKILTAFVAILTATAAIYLFKFSYSSDVRDPKLIEPSDSGVIYWNKDKAFNGINLLTAYARDKFYGCEIFDMEGKPLMHFPGNFCTVSPSGIAVTVYDSNRKKDFLNWFDQNFNLLWKRDDFAGHHDIFVSDSRKEIFLPVEEPPETYAHLMRENGGCVAPEKNLLQGIRGYDFSGKEIFRWRTLDHLEELRAINVGNGFDCNQSIVSISKINGVTVIDRHLSPADTSVFVPGNLLVSLDLCACLIVIDRNSHKVIWSFQPRPDFHQHVHNVGLTQDGQVVYFQNNFSEPYQDPNHRFSELVVLDPYSKQVTWSYRAKVSGAFFAGWGGSVQELPNKNFLVTHRGMAFEITRNKEIVWEWVNPIRGADGLPVEIYRVSRMPHSTWDLYK